MLVLTFLGDNTFLESVAGVAACAAIVLIWFWGWRRDYQSDWPKRVPNSALRY